jgi:hypothetical protein
MRLHRPTRRNGRACDPSRRERRTRRSLQRRSMVRENSAPSSWHPFLSPPHVRSPYCNALRTPTGRCEESNGQLVIPAHVKGRSRHRLEPHTHPIGSSPYNDAMPGGIVKVQVELHWQIESVLQPHCSAGRRKVSNGAIYREPSGQDDLADHQNLMPWNESAFVSLIRGNEPQRPPRRVPISRERRRQRQDTDPRLGFR